MKTYCVWTLLQGQWHLETDKLMALNRKEVLLQFSACNGMSRNGKVKVRLKS